MSEDERIADALIDSQRDGSLRFEEHGPGDWIPVIQVWRVRRG